MRFTPAGLQPGAARKLPGAAAPPVPRILEGSAGRAAEPLHAAVRHPYIALPRVHVIHERRTCKAEVKLVPSETFENPVFGAAR